MLGNRRRPRKGPLPFRYVFVISIAIFSILTAQGLLLVNKGIKPTIMDIAKTKTEQIATEAINDAISKKIVQSEYMKDLVIQYDNGNVEFNMQIFNRIQSEAIARVQNYLKKAEEGKLEQWLGAEEIQVEMGDEQPTEVGEVTYVPLGQATHIAILSNLGPRIPIRLTPMGSVEAGPIIKDKKVGINNVIMEVQIAIKVSVEVVIPFETDEITIETTVPAGYIMSSGDVPRYYAPGSDSNMLNPSIPVEPIDEEENEEKN